MMKLMMISRINEKTKCQIILHLSYIYIYIKNERAYYKLWAHKKKITTKFKY